MKRALMLIFCIVVTGCATGKKPAVPVEEFSQKVKTLAVLPVLVDAETIDYYSRDSLVTLLRSTTDKVQPHLIEQLRKEGDFFDVRPLEADPQELFTRLVAGHATIGETAATKLLYGFDPQASAELTDEAVSDAMLVVIIHGIKRQEKRWSSYSLKMEYLRADYSSLLYTAAIVDRSGKVLWQLDMQPDTVLLRLDYPDFTEAFWNRTDTVRIKSISLTGLRRTLQDSEAALLVNKEIPKPFSQMVDRIVSGMP